MSNDVNSGSTTHVLNTRNSPLAFMLLINIAHGSWYNLTILHFIIWIVGNEMTIIQYYKSTSKLRAILTNYKMMNEKKIPCTHNENLKR